MIFNPPLPAMSDLKKIISPLGASVVLATKCRAGRAVLSQWFPRDYSLTRGCLSGLRSPETALGCAYWTLQGKLGKVRGPCVGKHLRGSPVGPCPSGCQHTGPLLLQPSLPYSSSLCLFLMAHFPPVWPGELLSAGGLPCSSRLNISFCRPSQPFPDPGQERAGTLISPSPQSCQVDRAASSL